MVRLEPLALDLELTSLAADLGAMIAAGSGAGAGVVTGTGMAEAIIDCGW